MNDASGRPTAGSPAQLALGKLVVDLHRRALLDSRGLPVDVRPQVWAVLEHLAHHAGCVVTKEELLDAVWPGLEVTDGSVTQAISDVRALLGDTEHRVVKTMPRRGYMLLAEVLDDDPTATSAAGETKSIGEQATSDSAQALSFCLHRDAARRSMARRRRPSSTCGRGSAGCASTGPTRRSAGARSICWWR